MPSAVKPEEVYLSVLVHFFVHPPPPEHLRVDDRRSIARQLAVFLLRELKEPDSAVYPTLHQLCAKLRCRLGDLGVSLVSCLEVTLRNLRCTHDVFKLFGILEKLLVRNTDVRAHPQGGGAVAGLDPRSPLGLFIRRQRASFLGMSFEAVAQLYTDIAAEVAEADASGGCFAALRGRGPAAGEEGAGRAAEAAAGAGGRALRDRSSLEAFAARLLQRIEQQGPSLPQLALDAALAPLEAVPALLGAGSGVGAGGDERLPLARLVRLQAAMQHRDYTAELDLLHSYYNCQAPGASIRSRNVSGLLDLSALQTALGHTTEALPALSETMRLAQQANDSVALLQALALLCRLLAATAPGAPGLPPHGPAALRSGQAHHVQLLRMLRRCGERSQELGQPHLAAFAELALARFALLYDVEPSDSGLHAPPGSLTSAPAGPAQGAGGGGGGRAAAGVAEAVGAAVGGGGGWVEVEGRPGVETMSASMMVSTAVRGTLALGTAAALSAAAPSAPPPPAHDGALPQQRNAAAAADLYSSPSLFDRSMPFGAAGAIADAVQQMAGAAHLLQAAAWGLHGHDTLERVHTMMYLAAFCDPRVGCGAPARFEDRGTACAQLLAAAARRGPAAAQAAAAACLALLKAPPLGAESDGESTAVSGGQPGCEDAAATAGGGNDLALWGGPALATAWLCAAHDRALAVGDLAAAEAMVRQLEALADPQPHRDVDLRLEAAWRGARNLLAAGDTSAAQEAATELFARCADAGLQAPALRCLLLLAEIHLAAGDPHGALPHVLAGLLPAQPGSLPGAAGGGIMQQGSGGAAATAAAAGGTRGSGGGRDYDLLAAEALVLLCRVWHELADGQQLEEVLVLLQDVLPLILAHGSAHLQARAQLTIAEMVLAEAQSPADLTHCYSKLQRLLTGAVQAAAAAEDFRLGALAAVLLALLHQGQGSERERDEAAAMHEALMGMQAEAEAACAAQGRVMTSGLGGGAEAGGGWGRLTEALLGRGSALGAEGASDVGRVARVGAC